jgi:hypothetical protein
MKAASVTKVDVFIKTFIFRFTHNIPKKNVSVSSSKSPVQMTQSTNPLLEDTPVVSPV